ncbi:hypothetical protein XENORESO_002906, partial [Xenotaenia resolanae]
GGDKSAGEKRVEKLSKHERQGYSLIKRQGGDREERAWKTPQAAPGGKWVPNSKEAQRATKGQQKQVDWQGQKSSWSPICRRKTQGKTQEGGELLILPIAPEGKSSFMTPVNHLPI